MKKALFGIFTILSIIALVVTMVLLSKSDSGNPEIPTTDEQQTSIYATKVSILCPREITVNVGSSVKLDDNFINIEPKNTTEELEVEVSSKVGNNSGISFENNTIEVHEQGFYYIKFSVLKNENTYLYDTLVVHAVENNNYVIQKVNKVFLDDALKFSDIFDINSSFEVKNILPTNAEIAEDNVVFSSLGNADFTIELYSNYITYVYKFRVLVEEEPVIIEPDMKL